MGLSTDLKREEKIQSLSNFIVNYSHWTEQEFTRNKITSPNGGVGDRCWRMYEYAIFWEEGIEQPRINFKITDETKKFQMQITLDKYTRKSFHVANVHNTYVHENPPDLTFQKYQTASHEKHHFVGQQFFDKFEVKI